ncbi:MAG: YafY family protein [Pseudomonadota bacterium]
MRRADRLFQIVQHLRGGRRTTARKLAEALEVSERTIYRDIADLQGTGVPVEGEAGFGYVMADGFELPPLMFSQAEIVALVAGARMVRAWGGAAMASGAEEALVKIQSVLPEHLRSEAERVQVHSIAPDMTPDLAKRLDDLESAVNRRVRLDLEYADGDGVASLRTVRPLALWFWGKVWTLVCWCELRDDFRTFRLDRIQKFSTGSTYRPEPGKDLQTLLRQVETQDPPWLRTKRQTNG